MSNGVRHTLGVLAALIITPVIAGALVYGTDQTGRAIQESELDTIGRYLGIGALAAAALFIGLLAGSRLSPIASLISGMVFAAVGGLWVAAPRWASRNATALEPLPEDLRSAYIALGLQGWFLAVGVILLIASLFPSRWASRTAKADYADYEYGIPAPGQQMANQDVYARYPHPRAPLTPPGTPEPALSAGQVIGTAPNPGHAVPPYDPRQGQSPGQYPERAPSDTTKPVPRPGQNRPR